MGSICTVLVAHCIYHATDDGGERGGHDVDKLAVNRIDLIMPRHIKPAPVQYPVLNEAGARGIRRK